MGRRGPKPLPTATKVLRGTFRRDRVAENEPQPRMETPRCPSHLRGEARREWNRIVPELEATNLLTIVDRAALAAYCQQWARWVQAEGEIAKLASLTVTTPNGALQAHPAISVAKAAMSEMRRFLSEFGMTPSSRTRISAPPKEKKEANPFDELIG